MTEDEIQREVEAGRMTVTEANRLLREIHARRVPEAWPPESHLNAEEGE